MKGRTGGTADEEEKDLTSALQSRRCAGARHARRTWPPPGVLHGHAYRSIDGALAAPVPHGAATVNQLPISIKSSRLSNLRSIAAVRRRPRGERQLRRRATRQPPRHPQHARTLARPQPDWFRCAPGRTIPPAAPARSHLCTCTRHPPPTLPPHRRRDARANLTGQCLTRSGVRPATTMSRYTTRHQTRMRPRPHAAADDASVFTSAGAERWPAPSQRPFEAPDGRAVRRPLTAGRFPDRTPQQRLVRVELRAAFP